MRALVGLALALLLGVSIRNQGLLAILWVPLGFALGLFVAMPVVLPLLLGVPRAMGLVARGQMRPAVFGAIAFRVALWSMLFFGVLAFLVGWLWPAGADWLYNNRALNLSGALATLAVFLSPLSRSSRSAYGRDFDRAYRRFYIADAE